MGYSSSGPPMGLNQKGHGAGEVWGEKQREGRGRGTLEEALAAATRPQSVTEQKFTFSGH